MESLFTDDFPIAKNNDDLDRLRKQYPDYDGYYISCGSIPDRKNFFDELYGEFKPYADSNFLVDAKSNFHQRTWEMYLACVLLGQGCQISSGDKGPDIKLIVDGKIIWIECVAPQKGENNTENRVPDMKYNGGWQNVPEKQMLFRLRNSIDGKFRIYEKYISDGVVKKDDIFIIAVNRASLDHLDPGIPLILKVLFSIGYLSLKVKKSSDKKSNKDTKPFWSLQKEVPKKNGSMVPMDFFQNSNHSGISAVIYSKDNVLNCREKMGEDCILVHNPLATNSLPENIFPYFEQYKATKDTVFRI